MFTLYAYILGAGASSLEARPNSRPAAGATRFCAMPRAGNCRLVEGGVDACRFPAETGDGVAAGALAPASSPPRGRARDKDHWLSNRACQSAAGNEGGAIGMSADEAAILSRLDRLNALLFARDPAIVDELWSDRGFALHGSELGESARTRDELAALFGGLFARPFRLSWAWESRTVTRERDIAWVSAEGHIELTHADRVERQPYRMIGIFQKLGEDWRWRLFSGSEPAPPPAS
jgi:hypothetical protein